MPGRKFMHLTAADWLQIKEILDTYSVHCGEIAKQLSNGGTTYTDGYPAVKKGLFSLRNMLGKHLGKLTVSKPEIVGTWDSPRKKKVEPVLLNPGETIPIYDVSQGNPSIKAQAKAIKKILPDAKLKRKPRGKE